MNTLQPPTPPKHLSQALKLLEQSWSLIKQQQANIVQLEALLLEQQTQIDELLERIGKSSRNSSRSPSSDSPAHKAKRSGKPPSLRQQGAQPGHKKHQRERLQESQVDEIKRYFPPSHCTCGTALKMMPSPGYRHQVFDLPEVQYSVTEHQVYSGHCPHCQIRHTGRLPDWVPSGQMGPGLISSIVWLNGQFHLSIRQIQAFLKAQWKLDFSLGAISQAQGKANSWLSQLYRDIGDYVRGSEVAHADETSYYRGKERRWLWVLVTDKVCWFMTHYSRGMGAADILLRDFSGYLVTDHYAGYNRVDAKRRQLCWAHLTRNFIAISERGGQAARIGGKMLWIAHGVMRTRHRYQDDDITEAIYRRRMQRLRQSLQRTLAWGAEGPSGQRTTNQCRHLLKDEALCWTFLQDDRIPLTNNTAERALRSYVIWRKLSFACQSHRGEKYLPMALSVIGTLQRLPLLTASFLRTVCTEYMELGYVATHIPLEQCNPQLP